MYRAFCNFADLLEQRRAAVRIYARLEVADAFDDLVELHVEVVTES